MMTTMSAYLLSLVEFAFVKMGFAGVALDEDIFGFDLAFLGWNSLDALSFFAKPGHELLSATKSCYSIDASFSRMRQRLAHRDKWRKWVTTGLKLYTLLGANSRREGMFDFAHLRHQIRCFYQLGGSIPTSKYNVQCGL